jgi:hypothetical protein
MRTKKTSSKARRPVRLPARGGLEVKVGADVARCVTCGEPLVRLPRFLGAQPGSGHGFQCQRCFYANSAPVPSPSDVIASERTRWLSGVLSEPGSRSSGTPPPPAREED